MGEQWNFLHNDDVPLQKWSTGAGHYFEAFNFDSDMFAKQIEVSILKTNNILFFSD